MGSWIRNIRPTLINELPLHARQPLQPGARPPGPGSGKNGELGIGGRGPGPIRPHHVGGPHHPGKHAAQKRIQTPILTEQVIDTLTWVKGRHQLKTGFEFRYSRNQDINTPTTGGLFAFGDRATSNGLAALLLG